MSRSLSDLALDNRYNSVCLHQYLESYNNSELLCIIDLIYHYIIKKSIG